jgi:methionyl-tRNA formyltransferase
MQMDAGMDTGPMLLTAELPIGPEDTAGTMYGKLSQLGAELLAQGLALLSRGALPAPRQQDPLLATRAPMLDKEHGRADFTRSAEAVSAQLRGVDPWPGAFSTLAAKGPGEQGENGEVVLKLFLPRRSSGTGVPGQVLGVDRDGLHVACGSGAVALRELQLPGRKRLPAAALLSGHPIPPGTLLGGGLPNPRLSDPVTG